MALSPGTRLGHYDVTALLGEGGMGQVWQATDTQLNRQVALKILPDAFAADPDRLARFTREAQILASLNHPNIAAIYGIEEADGTRALVLELVEGPTLADRISKGPIPMDEALPIAKQIAEALEAAHEAGVIHRDLKPANIKVREDGTVKVLDFGLAKALDPNPEGDPSQSPTLTAAATQMGMVLGTAAYMSPEQAKGQTVDRRADVWAFGVVLYEMLGGHRPFAAADVAETLAFVLTREIDWTVLPSGLPPQVSWLLRRCLERDPRQRLRDIGEARVALSGDVAAAPVADVTLPTNAVALSRTRAWPMMLAGAIAGALVTGGIVWSVSDAGAPPPAPTVRFTAARLTTPLTDLTVSPDGTRLAYAAGLGDDGQLYLQDLREGTTLAIDAGFIGGGMSLAFSPDSEWVAFHSGSDSALKRLPVQGGPAILIAEVAEQPAGLSWGPDDTIVFSAQDRLMRVPASGGTAAPVTVADPALVPRWPEVLPNGTDVLVTLGSGTGNGRIAVASLTSGEITELGFSGTRPRYAGTGHLVFADSGNLRTVPFDADELTLTGGTPVPLREEVTVSIVGQALFDLSETGTLLYGGGVASTRSLVWVDRNGREEPIDAPPGSYITPRLSSDGERVAFDRTDAGDSNIWVRDLSRGTETLITTDPAVDWTPLWTPDDGRLVFFSRRDPQGLFSKAADGTGEVESLSPFGEDLGEGLGLTSPSGWSPDGLTLAVWTVPVTGQPDVGLVSVNGERALEPLLTSRFEEAVPAISPDGRWFAYHSAESGQREVYVQRFPNLGERTTISTGGGAQPQWSRDGRELFYRTPTGGMMVVPVEFDPAFSVRGDAELLFDQPYFMYGSRRTYDVASNGQRFLMVRVNGAGPDGEAVGQRVDIALNWFEELKRLVRTN